MELIIFPYLLHLAILCISLSLTFLIYKHKSNNNGGPNLPPGKRGIPIFGETLKFISAGRRGCPEKFFGERMKKYSAKIFQTSLVGENLAVFCGAAGNKFMFSNENKYVTTWWPRSTLKVLSFPEASSKEESTKTRGFLPEFFKPEGLQHYIPVVDSVTRKHLETNWAPNAELKAFLMAKKLTFALSCRLFMSIDDPDHVARISIPFDFVTAGITFCLPINFPGTAFNRAIKGAEIVRKELLAVVRKRKNDLEKKETVVKDLLTQMLLARDENGGSMDEKDIVNKIIGLLIASYDTTSTVMAFILKYLFEFPHAYDEVFKEQMEIAKSKGPEDLLNWNDIQKMKYSWNVACETMRLAPPSQGGFKVALTDFTYAGFTIPKGWKAQWTVHSTHKNPKYFPDPEKFDPSRFEGNGPAPFTFVAFGGGPRMCPGKEYARVKILVFMHNLVTRFKWKISDPSEKIECISSPIPEKGLPIHLYPIKS